MPSNLTEWFWTIVLLAFCGGSFYFGVMKDDYKYARANEWCGEWMTKLTKQIDQVRYCANLGDRERVVLSNDIHASVANVKAYCSHASPGSGKWDKEADKKSVPCRLTEKGVWE